MDVKSIFTKFLLPVSWLVVSEYGAHAAGTCGPRYTDCVERAEPYCKNQTASTPTVQRAAAYLRCVETYIGVCRSSHC